MRKLLLLSTALMLMVGCTTTVVETPYWSLHRKSFLQRIDIPSVQIATNGTATLRGYRTEGGQDVVGVAIDAAVSAALKGAKP